MSIVYHNGENRSIDTIERQFKKISNDSRLQSDMTLIIDKEVTGRHSNLPR